MRRVWSDGCVCAPTLAEVERLAIARSQRGADFAYQAGEDIVGTPAQVIEHTQTFVELGVDYFLLDCGGLPHLTTAGTLIADVLPVLSR